MSVRTSRPINSMASGGSGLWITWTTGSGANTVVFVSRLSEVNGRPVATAQVNSSSLLAISGRYAWAATTQGVITRVDRAGVRTDFSVPPRQGVRSPSVAFGDGGLWVSGLCDSPDAVDTLHCPISSYRVDEESGALLERVTVPDAQSVTSISPAVGGPWLVAVTPQLRYAISSLGSTSFVPLVTQQLPNRAIVPVTKDVVWAVSASRRPLPTLRLRPAGVIAGVPARGKGLLQAIPDGRGRVWLLEVTRGRRAVASLRLVAAMTGRQVGRTITIKRRITVNGTYGVTAVLRGAYVWIVLPNDRALLRVKVGRP